MVVFTASRCEPGIDGINASIEDVLLPSMRIENIKVVAHKQLI